jgi:hypothetical protein
MANPSPHDKVDFPDTFSEQTYRNDGPSTPYNIELNDLRSRIPDAHATRPAYMQGGYDPRYDGINNARPTGSEKAMRRVGKVYATMCCGSCLGFLAWIIGAALLITAFVLLLVKVVVSLR